MVIRRLAGFTVVEVLIVVAVLAMLLSAGIPAFTEFVREQRVKTASFDLFSTLVHARSEAITRNAAVTVTPGSAEWTNGWTGTRGSGRLNAASMPTFQLSASGATVTTRCISIDLSGRPTTKAAACS